MNRKIYKLLSGTKQVLSGLALTVFSGTAFSQNTYTFNYTANVQTITLQAGTYTIETWGADGGDNLGNGSTTLLQNGGKGGYSVGTYTLANATTVYVYVGGRGGNSTSVLNTTVSGGYNGGGSGSENSTSGKSSGAGGGGASHVATATGELSTLAGNQPAVLIVAGGGGGAGESNYANNNTSYNANGGHGGGISGEQNISSSYQGRHGKGGTQTAGGGGGDNNTASAGAPLQGIFGAGGYNTAIGANTSAGGSGAGGGGGGWYGGGAGWVATGTSYQAGSGGGGSSYLGGVTNGTTIIFGQSGFVTNPDVTGNGVVIIKELCSISLTPIGVNSSSAMCSGNSVTLTTNAVSNYSWSTGATSSSIVISPTTTTSYSLTALSPSNCTTRAIITVTVNGAVPSLTVVNTASTSAGICPNSTVNLLASGALSYTWAGGNQPVTNGVTFHPTIAAHYTVTGANGCGTASAVTSVSVHPIPVVTPVASSNTLCSGSSLTLSAQGNASTYTWTGGSVSFTNGIGFVPTTSTIYSLTGTSVLNCTAMATIPVTVFVTPTLVPVASPVIVCIGGSSTLSAMGALNYTWTSGSQTVNTSTMIVTPTSTGVTTYTVVKANSLCTDTRTIQLITNDLPTVAAIVMPQTVCALSPATLAAGGALSYTWTAPGTPNYTFTGASNMISTPVPATYTVAASDGTCINTATVHLATNPIPTISVSANYTSVCSGQPVSLSASGANSYTWTTGTNTFYTASVTDNPTVPTAYQVVGENSFGCINQANQVVLVSNSPTITAGPDKSLICSGAAVNFTAAGTTSYTWDTGSSQLSGSVIAVNPVSSVSGPVVYTVTGADNIGCQSTRTTQVNIYVPVLSISGSTNACSGGTLQLTASGGNSGSYSWLTGSAPIPGASLNTSLTAAGIYTVTASTTSLAITCPVSQTVAVDLHPNPVILASAERTTICIHESVELYANGGLSYQWNNGASHATITVSPQIQTTYTVTGTDANGCHNTGTVQVRVSACVGIAEANLKSNELLVYPNPNNGEFTIDTDTDVTLTLTNELGQAIRLIYVQAGGAHKVTVSDLGKGIYFLCGQKDNLQIRQKVVVMH
jgi:hypothetical protein